MFFTKLQELRSWIYDVRYLAGFPKRSTKDTNSGLTANIFRDIPTSITEGTYLIYHETKTAQSMKEGLTFWKPFWGQRFSESMSMSCSQTEDLNLLLLMPWKQLLTALGEPEYFTVILCSPERKALWRTNISSSDMFFQKVLTYIH